MLQVHRASRRFGARPIFSGLDLDLPAGTRLLLAGPNGSGKTTMLRCLAGTLTLTSGQAAVAGHPAGSPEARRLSGVCLSPEQGVYGRLSGHDNLLFAARLRLPWRDAAAAVTRVEREFGVEGFAATRVEHCSAGMRARVSLARAFLGEPALLLLDEPGRSLDEHATAQLWAAIDRRPELTCVVASHRSGDRSRCHHVLDLPVHR